MSPVRRSQSVPLPDRPQHAMESQAQNAPGLASAIFTEERANGRSNRGPSSGKHPRQKRGRGSSRHDPLRRPRRRAHGVGQHFWCREGGCRHVQKGFNRFYDFRNHLLHSHGRDLTQRIQNARQRGHGNQSTASSGGRPAVQPNLYFDASPEIRHHTQGDSPFMPQQLPPHYHDEWPSPSLSQYHLQDYRGPTIPNPLVPQGYIEVQHEDYDQDRDVPRYMPPYTPDIYYQNTYHPGVGEPALQHLPIPTAMPRYPGSAYNNVAQACLDATYARANIGVDANPYMQPPGLGEGSEYDIEYEDPEDVDPTLQQLDERTRECEALRQECAQLRSDRELLMLTLVAGSMPIY
ncbi:hypothetical protein F5Y14DRAFT_464734 [Nemania sp. NC0429]|nr:hypothetical protein F5Y14DRAFT_464734 [Nemania sp. NC0429]